MDQSEDQKFRENHCSEVSESEIEWWNSVEYLLEEPRPVIFSHPMLKSVLVLGGVDVLKVDAHTQSYGGKHNTYNSIRNLKTLEDDILVVLTCA